MKGFEKSLLLQRIQVQPPRGCALQLHLAGGSRLVLLPVCSHPCLYSQSISAHQMTCNFMVQNIDHVTVLWVKNSLNAGFLQVFSGVDVYTAAEVMARLDREDCCLAGASSGCWNSLSLLLCAWHMGLWIRSTHVEA